MHKGCQSIISLFSGIGAFEQAFQQLKIPYSVLLASDIDKFVKQSYEANYQAQNWISDVYKVDGAKYNDIDFLLGGSPCQSFSIAGKRTGLKSEKGLLYLSL